MKKDFFHILLERSRVGGGNDRKGRRVRKDSDLPSKQSTRRAHSDRKSLNENLNPLKRYLHQQVGRPWNDVHSEMCKVLKADSAVQLHVLGHIKDFIEMHAVIKKDGVYYKPRYYRSGDYKLPGDRLYVDPNDGVIKKTPHEKKKKYKQQTPLEEFIEEVNRWTVSEKKPTSRLELKDGKLYKVFWDKLVKEYTRYNIASTTHATQDFNKVYWGSNPWEFNRALRFSHTLWTLKNPYINAFLTKIAEKQEQTEKRAAAEREARKLREAKEKADKK